MKRKCEPEESTFSVRKKPHVNPTSAIFSVNDCVHGRLASNAFPFYRQPAEIGNFSQGSNREFIDSSVQLRYLHRPDTGSIDYDLRAGYNTYIDKDQLTLEYLNDLLTFISSHRDLFRLADPKHVSDG